LSNGTKTLTYLALLGVVILAPSLAVAQKFKSTFPRIGAYEISGTKRTAEPQYRQRLAKHDIVILGLWEGWVAIDTATKNRLSNRDIVVDIKKRAAAIGNNGILIGKYTAINESSSDPNGKAATENSEKLYSEVGPGYRNNNDWWARNSAGENTSSYRGNWNTNMTEYVTRDRNGDTWPEWAVTRNYQRFFRDIPELDIWFIDNWFYRPRVKADWDGDGVNDDKNSATLRKAFRKGFINGLRRGRQLAPSKIFMGNVDGDPQSNAGMLTESDYKGQITALYEGAIGMSWSQETWSSWESMMKQYQTTLANAQNRILIMTVHGDATDYSLMRYGLASCLMDDGYYYYTTNDTGYRSGLWFDEYDVDLGYAIDPPQYSAWQKGIYRRRFQNGVVLVNPKGNGTRTVQLESGYSRISGKQDPVTNSGQAVSSVTLAARDGIVLLNNQAPDDKAKPKPPILSQVIN